MTNIPNIPNQGITESGNGNAGVRHSTEKQVGTKKETPDRKSVV